jgi:hypothetical protein
VQVPKIIDRYTTYNLLPTTYNLLSGETPIRDYAKESWGYLQSAHPAMARFMDGTLATDGSTVTATYFHSP